MIRFFENRDKNTIISLWHEAFGDKNDEIAVFLEFIRDNLVIFEENGKIVSMLTLLNVKIGEDRGRYVYAVATDKSFRGRGYATALLSFAKEFIKKNDEKFLVLLPQESSLFEFYEKAGFSELFCAEIITCKDFSKSAKKVGITSAKEYFELRKAFFSQEKYVEWDVKSLEFMKEVYGGEFVCISDNSAVSAIAFCHKNGEKLFISELLSSSDADENVNALAGFFKADSMICIKAQKNGARLAMIYPSQYVDTYFGLGMNF